MVREDTGAACPASFWKRTAAERKERRRWAAFAADQAVHSLSRQLAQTRARLKDFETALTATMENEEFADRVTALAPALLKMLVGTRPTHEEKLRRNVALHAEATGMMVGKASTLSHRSCDPCLVQGVHIMPLLSNNLTHLP